MNEKEIMKEIKESKDFYYRSYITFKKDGFEKSQIQAFAKYQVLHDLYNHLFVSEDHCRECGDTDSLNEFGEEYICSSCLSD